jgi:hypothetical protein
MGDRARTCPKCLLIAPFTRGRAARAVKKRFVAVARRARLKDARARCGQQTKRLATSPFCFEVASLIAFRATPLNQQPVAGIAGETRCMGKCFFIVENSRQIHLSGAEEPFPVFSQEHKVAK